MPSGGSRARSGPAPDPNALRRERDAGEWTVLPAEGRQGATPDWPLSGQMSREQELWERLWKKPQALMWERYGQELDVALYVRRFCEAEESESKVNLSTLIRQMGDALGLSTPGLRANRWQIVRDDEAARPAGKAPTQQGKVSSRSRLTVVPTTSDGD